MLHGKKKLKLVALREHGQMEIIYNEYAGVASGFGGNRLS